jgi:hypothetical protein
MLRTRVLAWQVPWLAALLGASAGCGDPVLPSDYAGPPAANVTADVLVLGTVTAKDAAQPRLSLEWLASWSGLPGQSTLIGQPLRFSRSVTLQADWDIGLELPIALAKLNPGPEAATGGLRVGVGKMVYFDDRNGDGRLDWSCQGLACDQAKAVSVEYVVYVEGATACRNATTAPGALEVNTRPTAGYNYYQLQGGTIRKLRPGEPMRFLLADRSLPESNPSDELRTFAKVLFSLWSLGQLSGGC